jgi:hypothetical protein
MSIEQAIKELYPELNPEEQNQMVVDIKLEQGVPLLQSNLDDTNENILERDKPNNITPIEQQDEQPIQEQDNEQNNDEVQKETSYNGAQISSAILIVQEFINGILSYEAAIIMLMEFLKIERPLAEKMINEKAKQEAKKAMTEQVKQ